MRFDQERNEVELSAIEVTAAGLDATKTTWPVSEAIGLFTTVEARRNLVLNNLTPVYGQEDGSIHHDAIRMGTFEERKNLKFMSSVLDQLLPHMPSTSEEAEDFLRNL